MADDVVKKSAFTFNGDDIHVKELTVAQVAEVMDEMEDYKPHVLDLLMQHDVPFSVVVMSTGLEEEKLMSVGPSCLDPLYEEVLKVNPSLAALTRRLRKIMEEQLVMTSGKTAVTS